MDNSLAALVLPPMLIVPAMGLLSRVRSTSPLGCELRRKALHISIGLAALTFPYLLTRPWMVLTALATVAVWMICVRRNPYLRCRFGRVLHDAGRESHGELYFAVALAWLLIADRAGSFQYAIPLLILTVSDAAAAIVGRSVPVGRFAVFGNSKSASGSAAFLVSAFVIAATCLSMGTALPAGQVLAVSMTIAITTAVAEAVSVRGLDNLSVPLSAWLILSLVTYGA
jgi:phytol kinase